MQCRALALLSAALLACSTPAAPPPPTAVALPSGVPTAAPGWTTTAYWLGNGTKDTETFTTTRPEWRLVWRSTKGLRDLVLVQVMDANGQDAVAASVGGIDVGGTTTIRVPPGQYFLRVQAVFADWAVAVEEAR